MTAPATQPRLVVVGGPNGAGKTTFATEYAERQGVEYLGADQIAYRLSPTDPQSQATRAGRIFVEEVRAAITERRSLVIESTLSGRTLRRTLVSATAAGYTVSSVFLFVDSEDACVARVAERVRKGGHLVPEADIRRRFRRTTTNFWTLYRPVSDDWMLLYNGRGDTIDVAAGTSSSVVVRDRVLFETFSELVDDPAR